MADALHYASDHLPVMAKFSFESFSVGVNDPVADNLKIYPNLASDNVVAELQDNRQYSLYIRDIQGAVLFSDAMFVNKADISIESLNPGYYIIQLISEAGIVNKYMVIQK